MNITQQHPKGFTLIELMVSMFIGIVVFGGVFTTFKNQKLLYSRQEKIIKMSQDTRAALNIMRTYIKKAGISVANCSFTDDKNICTGLKAINTNYFTITSDTDLSGDIIAPSQIASNMEEVTFIRGNNNNSLYICAGTVTNSPENNNKCQFILDNIKKFEIKGCYTDSSGTTTCSTSPANINDVDSIQVTLQAETKDNEITEANNTKLAGSEIVARVFFINKTFQ